MSGAGEGARAGTAAARSLSLAPAESLAPTVASFTLAAVAVAFAVAS